MTRLGGGGGSILVDIQEATAELTLELTHDSLIFPVDTDDTMTFTADIAANTWTAWTELVDNNAVTFSSKLAANIGHISAIVLEQADTSDAHYLIELAYGASTGATPITPKRFYTGAVPVKDMRQLTKVRSAAIPAGQTVWYRAKCDVAGSKTCNGHLRYHFDA